MMPVGIYHGRVQTPAPARPTRTRARDPRVREALLDAAAGEFWRHGLAGTRIQDILEHTTASRTSLYVNFAEGKEDIAQALVAERRWQALVEQHALGTGRGLDLLESFLTAIAERVESDLRARALVRVAHELPDPEGDSGLRAWRSRIAELLEQASLDGSAAGLVARDDVADGLMVLLQGAILAAESSPSVLERVRLLWLMVRPGLVSR